MTQIAIILGDPHIGKSLSIGKTTTGSTLNSRLVDQFNLLDWTLDRALELNAQHIIATGDIFEDPKPPTNLIVLFMGWLKKCSDNGVYVHLIMGNHDILRHGSIYTSPLDIISEADIPGVHVYKDTNTIFIGSAAFTLMPFRDRKSLMCPTNAEAVLVVRDSLVYELASIPHTYYKIAIGHYALEGSLPIGDEIDDLANELLCPLDMFLGYQFVWMGHVHRPQVLSTDPHIAHIGSMDISNFGETNHQKHIVVFDCQEGTWTQEILPTRPLQKMIVSVPKDTDDTTAYVIQQLQEIGIQEKGIVRVEVSLSSPELTSINKTVIDKFLLSQGTFVVSGISESKKLGLIKKEGGQAMDTKMDVSTAINAYAQLYIDDQQRSDFIELANEIHQVQGDK